MLFRRRHKKSLWLNVKHSFNPQKGWKRVIKYFLYRLKRLPGTPEFIARGFAFGIAVNYWPILGTHLLLGYLLCRIFKANLISMAIGTLLGNPWTFAILYPLSYKLGKVFLGLRLGRSANNVSSAEDIWARIWPVHSWDQLDLAWHDIVSPMIVGGFLLGLPSALLGYYLVRNALRVYQLQRRKRLQAHFQDVGDDIKHIPGNVL